MAREFWLLVKDWKKEVVMDAIEIGFNGIFTPPEYIDQIRELARVKIISADPEADMILGTDVFELHLDEKNAGSTLKTPSSDAPVILYSDDWRVIPMENLLASRSNVIQHVRCYEEAELSLESLERGADGILLETSSVEEIRRVGQLITRGNTERVLFDTAQVTSISQVGVGDRVAVDFCSLLEDGRGVLVGNSSSFLFLVQNENVDNPYCDKRPFRVNAGGAHSYVRMPFDETKYLIELQTGMSVLTVDPNGESRSTLVGRSKMEKRSMLLINAKVGDRLGSILLQNAETIRLTKPGGESVSVTKIEPGDEILVQLDALSFGRHFGKRVKETIREK